jgi:nitrate reductase (NAD(P)H)
MSNLANNFEYKIQGYAYTGNGTKLTRVEVSLDRGNTWLLTKLTQPELEFPLVLQRNMNPLPRFWCWTFWDISIPIHSLIRCEEISVRAWDATHNTQPRDQTWNLMGMMNNCHYKVKVHSFIDGKEFGLRFEHPTQPGNNLEGWMVKKEPKLAIKDAVPIKTSSAVKTHSLEQVSKHNNENDCWIIIDKKVYDTTKFLKNHPGGKASILINAGTDVTDEFNAIHSAKARDRLSEFYIGDLSTPFEKSKL